MYLVFQKDLAWILNSFLPGKTCALLGIHPNTLRTWYKQNRIQGFTTDGGRFLYNVSPFVTEPSLTLSEQQSTPGKLKVRSCICYCRVSSRQQKADLEKQVQFLSSKYPNHDIIKDIGSGLNFKRPGLQKMVDKVLSGNVQEIVVAHKDRLCRFGFDLLQFIFDRSNTRLVVLEQSSLSPEKELTGDLLSILHVFSCRMYGLRKYKKRIYDSIRKETSEKEDLQGTTV